MKPEKEYNGQWKRPDRSTVQLLSHATHLENIPSMIESVAKNSFRDKRFAKVKFTPRQPGRSINGLPTDCKLLYFACPLGPAGETDCRYGQYWLWISLFSGWNLKHCKPPYCVKLGSKSSFRIEECHTRKI